MLCKVGADVNTQTKDDLDWSALHIAALNGYPEVVKVLLEVRMRRSHCCSTKRGKAGEDALRALPSRTALLQSEGGLRA